MMRTKLRRAGLVLAVLAVSASAAAVSAGTFSDPYAAGFHPRVPISQLAGAASWFDPARLHLTSTIAVGSGFSSGTHALQTTSFSYQFRAPVALSVSVGNAFGPGAASQNAAFFLQGVDLAWQPNSNSLLRIQFQNVRSPLQYGFGNGNGYRGLGYGDAADRAFWGN